MYEFIKQGKVNNINKLQIKTSVHPLKTKQGYWFYP